MEVCERTKDGQRGRNAGRNVRRVTEGCVRRDLGKRSECVSVLGGRIQIPPDELGTAVRLRVYLDLWTPAERMHCNRNGLPCYVGKGVTRGSRLCKPGFESAFTLLC